MLSIFQTRIIPRATVYILAAVIIVGSLFYSNYLAERLSEKETQSVELYAEAVDFIGNLDLSDSSAVNSVNSAVSFITDKLIFTDEEGNPVSAVPRITVVEEDTQSNHVSLPLDPSKKSQVLRQRINEWKTTHDPIIIEFDSGRYQYVYHGPTLLLIQLRWFPVIQLCVAFFFISVVFAGFAVAKRNEQNRVWVGLAKETAHQLGTPVSSLMAWVELLKLKLEDNEEDLELVEEMERDIRRLENIAERFSKIGSKPELKEESLSLILDRSAQYIKKRMSKRGNIQLYVHNDLPLDNKLNVNPQLFDWVIENLLKNALDAIQTREGSITLHAGEKGSQYFIEVSDTGKGIPKSHFTKVFEPGYTTKKRGWGLGLSLTKRIVENYHQGKIFVKASEMGKGTTFRILLPKRY